MTAFAALDVLIVDDHQMMRSMLERALRAAGAERVRTAASGRQALALLAEQPADVVISDHNMPDIDGTALVRCLRADPRHTAARIVMLTGNPDLLAAARDAGADLVLIKPMPPRDLLRAIAGLLA
jgi:CheY-like chemotaxis protein